MRSWRIPVDHGPVTLHPPPVTQTFSTSSTRKRPNNGKPDVRQCLPSSGRVCQETGCPTFPTQENGQTTPTRGSSSTHAQEETPQTKDLHDPDGTGPGLSQHCPASVFSSQTIDLQFVGGTRPSQQTEGGPVAIKGPCTLWDAPLVHHE